ncbi:MAG: D-glycero-beta-D-manno-heptose 1-phosphate adenylyltransferase [Elusimicrobia bacterium]|nr:D-glycero-beta-D-manno-heptose 1-phosphate adenylyltransferase [Elusimicrobiota bacterium]
MGEKLKKFSAAGKKKIVFTNGCFDIIHPGHVYLLKKAKSFGDILVVGLNSNSSVARIKKGRPINNFRFRSEVLDSLKFVDFVCGFSEKTPLALIKRVRPDVLVKGGDWKESEVVGADFVKSLGGEVKIIPYKKGFSTTGIIKKVKMNPPPARRWGM